MTSHEIETWTAGRVSDAQLRAVCVLLTEAFPKAERTLDEMVQKLTPRWIDGDQPGFDDLRAYVVRDGDRVVAHAATLVRTVGTPRGDLTVLGLAGVASAASHRGRGLGRRVIEAALRPVDDGAYPVSLFQTGPARGLYEKLGGRVVDNRFVNSASADDPEANPFTDEVAMIYPGDAGWPDGPIDLRGPGY